MKKPEPSFVLFCWLAFILLALTTGGWAVGLFPGAAPLVKLVTQ